ncbi:MAG TPA: putative molybdenum carrier protein [Steroidobacteraceae bacterium]|nr:putative molybdenum carrier protein [Steroidobacteraceae bacterium]
MTLEKIISGGQTGVDRGALDAALDAGFPCGGFCPQDRAAEDGTIPLRYPLTPLPGAGYTERTLQNVLDSDGTVILASGTLTGGTLLTKSCCERHTKPCLVIDAATTSEADAVTEIQRLIRACGIRILNVAGPRESLWPAGQAFADGVIRRLLA